MSSRILIDHYLFASFNSEQRTLLEKMSIFKTFHAGDILFYEGEPANTLHIIDSGSVTVYKCDSKGNEIVMGEFGSGDMVAEMPCFDHAIYPASGRCSEKSVIIRIDYSAFEKHFLRDPDVALNILKSMTLKIKSLEQTISRNLAMDATEKAARFIYDNPVAFVSMKQKDVARQLHIAPETLSRVLKKFKNAGILQNDKGHIRILDVKKLESYIHR